MSPSDRRIAKDEWVLVTGANSYIATQVIDVLLEEGYHVCGTVRSEKPAVNKFFDEKYGPGRFHTKIVENLNEKGAFDEAVKGMSGVIHVASDVSFGNDPDKVINWTVAGTIEMLEAAARSKSVKSVVLTSSSAALLNPEPNKKVIIDENTWNDEAVEAAYNKDTPAELMPLYVYCASKTMQEREYLKWVKENKPSFAASTVLPNLNMGQIIIPGGNASTMGWVRGLLDGEKGPTAMFPPQYFIDVRDVARLHVAALLDPSVNNERIFGLAHTFNWTEVYGVLRKLRPNNKKIPQDPENEGQDITVVKPRDRAEGLLKSFFGRPGWTTLEESIKAGIADLP